MNEFAVLIPWVKIYIFISLISSVAVCWATIQTLHAQAKAMKNF